VGALGDLVDLEVELVGMGLEVEVEVRNDCFINLG